MRQVQCMTAVHDRVSTWHDVMTAACLLVMTTCGRNSTILCQFCLLSIYLLRLLLYYHCSGVRQVHCTSILNIFIIFQVCFYLQLKSNHWKLGIHECDTNVPKLKIDLNHRNSRIKVLACHEPVCFSWYHMSWHEPDNMKSIISMIFTWLLLLPLLYHRPASSGIVIRQNWTHHSRNKTNIQSTRVRTSHLYESMSLLLGNEIQM